MSDNAFGDSLRVWRRNSRDHQRGGQLSQNRLADLLSEEVGLVFSRAAVSDWERGKGHIHKDARPVLVGLIKVLHEAGGLPTRKEAEAWLASGNYRGLDAGEAASVDPAWIAPPTEPDVNTLFLPLHPIVGRDASLTPFIGRQQPLHDLIALLQEPNARLVSVVGPGGIGKTRLAQEAANLVADEYKDGVWFVPLDAVQSTADLLDRWLAELSIQRDPAISVISSLVNFLRQKQALILLDTFENLLDAGPILVDVLRLAPNIRLLVTSRAVLNTSGEHVFRVPPMHPVYADAAVGEVADQEAVALFVNRVQMIRPDFRLDESNEEEIIAICQRIDGLPLAIELAAGLMRALSLHEIRSQLEKDPGVLSGGPRDAPIRQRSLDQSLSWSFDALLPEEQTLFERLSIFSSGFSIEAAQAVASRDLLSNGQFVEALTTLVDHSLLHYETWNSHRIYRMHELTRQFAAGKLAMSGQTDVTMGRLLDFLLDLAGKVDRHLRNSERAYWLERIDPEARQVWLIVEWAVESKNRDAISDCLRLAGHLLQYWNLRGQVDRARRWTEQILAVAESLDIPTTSARNALCTAAALALIQADATSCESRATKALEASRVVGDLQAEAHALHLLGLAMYYQGDLERAKEFWDNGLHVGEHLDDPSVVARALDDLGNLASRQGNFQEALALHGREQEISQASGDLYSEFYAVLNLGEVSMRLKQPLQADRFNRRALEISRELDDSRGLAHTLVTQARLLRDLERLAEARDLLLEALTLGWSIGNLDIALTALEQIVLVTPEMNPEMTVQLLGSVDRYRGRYGPSSYPEDKPVAERQLRRMREELSDEAYTTAWLTGQQLDWEEAIELANRSASGSNASPSVPQ